MNRAREALSPCAARLVALLDRYTTLARSILKAQCEIAGLSPGTLRAEHVPVLSPGLVGAVGRFTSPEKQAAFQRDLSALRRTDTTSTWAESTQTRSSAALFRPPVELDVLASRVLEVLEGYTPLAWLILESQCSRARVDARRIAAHELEPLLPSLAKNLARYTSTDEAGEAVRKLQTLVREELTR